MSASCRGSSLVAALCWIVATFVPSATAAQALPEDSEEGFRRFMAMAEAGELGDDVIRANVGVVKDRAHIELVRTPEPSKFFVLTIRESPHAASRFFDVAPDQGATPDDVRRVGAALDRAFTRDPFRLTGVELFPGHGPRPGVFEAWNRGGWRGVLRAAEVHMMTAASLRRTITVSLLLGVGLIAATALLWSAPPPPRRNLSADR